MTEEKEEYKCGQSRPQYLWEATQYTDEELIERIALLASLNDTENDDTELTVYMEVAKGRMRSMNAQIDTLQVALAQKELDNK